MLARKTFLLFALALGFSLAASADDETESSIGSNLDFDDTPTSWVTSASCGSTAVVSEVPEWSIGTSAAWTAAGAYEVDGSGTLQDITAPSTDSNDEASGGVLGLIAAWGASVQYTQEVTLEAGIYKISYAAYNGRESGATSIAANLIGFIDSDGNTYYGSRMAFPFQEWVTDEFVFELSEETTGKLAVGITGGSSSCGSGYCPALFIDYITIEKTDYSAIVDYTSSAGSWSGTSGTCTVSTDVVSLSDVPEYYSSSAISAGQVITQTVSGLEAGTYELQLYATAHAARITASTATASSVFNALTDIAQVYATSGETTVSADVPAYTNTALASTEPYTYVLYIDVEENQDLSFGIEVTAASEVNWLTIYLKSLKQLMSSDAAASQFATLVDSAKAVIDKGDTLLGTGIKATLQAYADTTGVEDYATAIEELSAALAAVESSIELNSTLWEDSASVYVTNAVDGWTNTTSSALAYNTWSEESDSYVTAPFLQVWGTSTMSSGSILYTEEGLLEGSYTLKGTIRFYAEKSNMTELSGATLVINGEETDLSESAVSGTCASYTAYYAFISQAVEVGSDGTLTFGLSVGSDANYSWVAFKDFYYYVTPDEEMGDAVVSGVGSYVDASATELTLTITYPEAAISGSTASLQEGSTTTKPTLDATEGTATLADDTLTVTFTGLTLTAGTTYTITIPAGLVKISDNTANEEITLSFTAVSVVADGNYYFKVADEYQYLTRGGNWGTELTLGDVGTLFTISATDEGDFNLITTDRYVAGFSKYYVSGPTSAYVDASSPATWTLEEASDSTYYIVNSNGNYLVGSLESTYGYYWISETSEKSSAPAFELLSRDEYKASCRPASTNRPPPPQRAPDSATWPAWQPWRPAWPADTSPSTAPPASPTPTTQAATDGA